MKRSILVTVALLSSMLIALMPASAPGGVIEKPVWNVGDSWSMGKTIDLSQYEQEIQTMLEEMGEGNSVDLAGGIGYYQTIKVTKDAHFVGGEKCYELTLKAAFGANMEADISMSMSDPYMGDMSMSGHISAVIDIWIDGYAYFTVEELAIKKIELVLKAELNIEGDMEMIQDGVTQSASISMEAKNIEIEVVIEFDPALDLFDFPIENGETWWVPEVDTTQDMSVSSSGTLSMKMSSGGYTMDENLDLSDDMYQTEMETIIEKHTIEITAAKVETHYDLEVAAEGLDTEIIPIDDLGLPIPTDTPTDMTLKYDPEEGFIDSAGVDMGGDFELALDPASESEVDAFYADPSAGVPGPGLELWLILLIVGVIVAVVVVVAVLLVRRGRRKPAEGVYGPPGAPPQPGMQPYPPQQPQGPYQPQPPPQQPYSPPPPPPPPPPQP